MSDFPQRSLLRTMWIAFLLGPFGVHRFYTGYKGSAWFQFVACGMATVWLATDLILMVKSTYNGVSFVDATWTFVAEHWIIRLIQIFIWGVGVAYVSADMARIVAGRFKDALGRPLLTSDEPAK